VGRLLEILRKRAEVRSLETSSLQCSLHGGVGGGQGIIVLISATALMVIASGKDFSTSSHPVLSTASSALDPVTKTMALKEVIDP
jgi:hypothetical protein